MAQHNALGTKNTPAASILAAALEFHHDARVLSQRLVDRTDHLRRLHVGGDASRPVFACHPLFDRTAGLRDARATYPGADSPHERIDKNNGP